MSHGFIILANATVVEILLMNNDSTTFRGDCNSIKKRHDFEVDENLTYFGSDNFLMPILL